MNTIFLTRAKNLSAAHAFELEQRKAKAEFGGDSRNGTIATKATFQLITDEVMEVAAAIETAMKIMRGEAGYEHLNREDGPAGAIPVGRLEWLFFGRAPA